MKDRDITVDDWLAYLAINPDENPISNVDLANFRMEMIDSSTPYLDEDYDLE